MSDPKFSILQMLTGAKDPNVLLTMVGDWQKLYEQEKQINDQIKKNYSFFRPIPFLPFLYIRTKYKPHGYLVYNFGAGHVSCKKITKYHLRSKLRTAWDDAPKLFFYLSVFMLLGLYLCFLFFIISHR
jgi:hypothetical protein